MYFFIYIDRIWRGIKSKWNFCTPDHWNYRVRIRICFKYCFISETLGFVFSTFTTFISVLWKNCSRIFIDRVVGNFNGNIFILSKNLIGFSILASTTAGIMLLMDTMECFLHTLRLHWVEFQNKFYKGDGYSLKSFNFKSKINEHIKQTSLKNDWNLSFLYFIGLKKF